MAKQQDSNQEPSIEEILDSIRQIISDDDEQAAPETAPAPVKDDVIELTERAPHREDIQVDLKETAEPEQAYKPEPLAAAAPPPPKPEPKPEPVVAKTEPPPRPPVSTSDTNEDFNSILTKNAEDSVMGAFSELTKHTSINKGDGITVEDVVREELRPLLKQWLDKHLPSMVERLVQKELDRISKRVIGDE